MPKPQKIPWTDGQDTQIRRRRIEGASWETIAGELALPQWAVTARARRIGVDCGETAAAPAPEDPQREPLPSGHPTSWRAITAGTVLQKAPYPLRVFGR